MSSWDVARLTVRLGDHNIKTNTEIRHVEKRVKRIVRHRGFDPRTLVMRAMQLDSPRLRKSISVPRHSDFDS
jgi:acetolactate synthase regulatory subunit